jgi:hypothetical protein
LPRAEATKLQIHLISILFENLVVNRLLKRVKPIMIATLSKEDGLPLHLKAGELAQTEVSYSVKGPDLMNRRSERVYVDS